MNDEIKPTMDLVLVDARVDENCVATKRLNEEISIIKRLHIGNSTFSNSCNKKKKNSKRNVIMQVTCWFSIHSSGYISNEPLFVRLKSNSRKISCVPW